MMISCLGKKNDVPEIGETLTVKLAGFLGKIPLNNS
jgi:hypothetical protein